jgi:prolyl 4-hydroxylase
MPEIIEYSDSKTVGVNGPEKKRRSPISYLSGEWVSWIIENIDQGCTLSSLESVMRKNGFDAEFAGIAVVGIHDFHITESGRPDASPRRLKPAWQQWLRENIRRGCSDELMLASMSENGFEAALVTDLLKVTRAYLDRPHPLIGRLRSDECYTSDPIRVPPGNQICIDGHSIYVSSVMHSPCVAVLDHVLTDAECEALIERASGCLNRSGVVDRQTGASVLSSVRTSEGPHFERGDGELIKRIEQRLARLIDRDVDRFEPMQILRYSPGGEYKSHQDYFAPDEAGSQVQSRRGGNRIATFILYLNEVEQGGETGFPDLKLDVRPRRGRAVYFEYMNTQFELDPRCKHAGQPVIQGEKWIATKWVRAARYESAQR